MIDVCVTHVIFRSKTHGKSPENVQMPPIIISAEEYTVHYDRGSGKPEEINMGFTSKKETECGQCEGAMADAPFHRDWGFSVTFMGSPKASKTLVFNMV